MSTTTTLAGMGFGSSNEIGLFLVGGLFEVSDPPPRTRKVCSCAIFLTPVFETGGSKSAIGEDEDDSVFILIDFFFLVTSYVVEKKVSKDLFYLLSSLMSSSRDLFSRNYYDDKIFDLGWIK